MDTSKLEEIGAIKINDDGRYIVRVEQILEILSVALADGYKVEAIGRTSKMEGAAYIVSITPNERADEFKDDFFVRPEGGMGLSQALLDVVERRS
ncbi:hypothetical protein ACC778_36090 [Rhizobium ruizarguesonis]